MELEERVLTPPENPGIRHLCRDGTGLKSVPRLESGPDQTGSARPRAAGSKARLAVLS